MCRCSSEAQHGRSRGGRGHDAERACRDRGAGLSWNVEVKPADGRHMTCSYSSMLLHELDGMPTSIAVAVVSSV